MSGPSVEIDVHLDERSALHSMPREVREGLRQTPKHLPSKYFYDERGSRLFEQITELPEYYPTRAERQLLVESSQEILELTRAEELLELGPGSAKKTDTLIRAGLEQGTLERYVPFEVSYEITERAAERLSKAYPELDIHAVIGDFENHLDRVPHAENRLVAFLGSSIGNLPDEEGVEFLRKVAGLLDEDGFLLLGTDLVKDTAVLEAAYNDSQGVTAEFNLNILDVVNRHLGGDFDRDAFEHVAFYNAERERIEMHLESRRDQSVELEALEESFEFVEGERVRTEVSCKYTLDSVQTLLDRAGFKLRHFLTGEQRQFALSVAGLKG